jgi:cytochrome P450
MISTNFCLCGYWAGEKYFLCWFGKSTRLVVRDPEIAKEVFITNHAALSRFLPADTFLPRLLGKGLLINTGEKWVTERRTINPFFHHDALKVHITLEPSFRKHNNLMTPWY